MDKNNFDELLASVHEMDQIVAGTKKASRQFDFRTLKLNHFKSTLKEKTCTALPMSS